MNRNLKSLLVCLAAQAIADGLQVDRAWAVTIGWIMCAISFEMDRNKTWRAEGKSGDAK